MKQKLTEIKAFLNAISVKGDDVIFMAEAQVRLNELIKECDAATEAPKESEVNG